MGARKPSQARRPASTPEGRENQLISLAYDRAEQQLRDNTASSQVISHFLKMGSVREDLERTRLEHENLMISAKVDLIQSQRKSEALYQEAIDAFREYSGHSSESHYED